MSAQRHNYRGRPVSWISVVLILTGFALGGIALTVSSWVLFSVGAGIVVVGGVLALATDIFQDVLLDPLHQDQADVHVSPIRGVVSADSPPEVDPTFPGQAPEVTPDREGTEVPKRTQEEE